MKEKMPTAAQIAAELTTDPSGMGYATILAARNDVELTAMLNDTSKGVAMVQPLPMLEFAKWAAGSGVWQKLIGGQSNSTVGAVCDCAILMFGQLTLSFDPTDTATAAMMAALVTASVLAAGDVTAATTACTQPASRAENLWGVGTANAVLTVSTALNAAG